jgi:hypothetical protein
MVIARWMAACAYRSDRPPPSASGGGIAASSRRRPARDASKSRRKYATCVGFVNSSVSEGGTLEDVLRLFRLTLLLDRIHSAGSLYRTAQR